MTEPRVDPAVRWAWRTGRKVGRTIYAVTGSEPSDNDVLIGVMDTPSLARAAVDAHNARTQSYGDVGRMWQALVDIAGHENWQSGTAAQVAREALESSS